MESGQQATTIDQRAAIFREAENVYGVAKAAHERALVDASQRYKAVVEAERKFVTARALLRHSVARA